jgi:transposase-like protein
MRYCVLRNENAMSQHFLLSKAAKTLSLAQVLRLSDAEAEATFSQVRWPETNGKPVCPHCGGLDPYDCRRPNGAPRFECRACGKDFSITSGTLFASHKLPLRTYLAAIAIFCNEVKGKSALALSRDLGVSYKCAFVLQHKLREAMASEMKGRVVGGEGKVAEIDGGYFGGYVKPANKKENRKDRRFTNNQSGKRKVVVIVRERGGNSVPAVFRSEGQALNFIRARVAKGTIINADEGNGWNDLHGQYEMKRINHQALTALARIGQRNISAVCAVPKSAITTISPVLICCAMRKRLHGAKITAAWPTAIKYIC